MSITVHDLSLITLMIFETSCAFIVEPLSLDSPISADVSFSQFSVLLMQDIHIHHCRNKITLSFGRREILPLMLVGKHIFISKTQNYV